MKTLTFCFFTVAGCLFGMSLPVWSASSEPVVILDQKDEWQNVYGLLYYRVTGHVKNASGQPLKFVKFELELLDKDGKVVAHQVGYNQKAQVLAEEKGGGEGEEVEAAGTD